MRKRVIPLVLAVMMVISVLPVTALAASSPFTDVSSSDWFYNEVLYANDHGLMKGTGNNTFSPDRTISRGEFVTILYRQEGEPDVTGYSPFPDVLGSMYYTDAVIWATQNKIVEGYDTGLFGVNDPVSRSQFAVILYRYTQYKGVDVDDYASLAKFPDSSTLSDWNRNEMAWAVAKELINGSVNKQGATVLDPNGGATRAMAAKILYNYIESVIATPKKVFTVTFNLNFSGAATPWTQQVTEGNKVAMPVNPAREGYTFNGWYTAASGGKVFDFNNTVITADITLYAHWTEGENDNSGNGGGSGSGNNNGGTIPITGAKLYYLNADEKWAEVTSKFYPMPGDVLRVEATPSNAIYDTVFRIGEREILVRNDEYTVQDTDIGLKITAEITGIRPCYGTRTTATNPVALNAGDIVGSFVKNSKLEEDEYTGDAKDGIIYLHVTPGSTTLNAKELADLEDHVATDLELGNYNEKTDKWTLDSTVAVASRSLDIKATYDRVYYDKNEKERTEARTAYPAGELTLTLPINAVLRDEDYKVESDASKYLFYAYPRNVNDGTNDVNERVEGEVIIIDEAQYVRFTVSGEGLNAVRIGYVKPLTVKFESSKSLAEAIPNQTVKIGENVENPGVPKLKSDTDNSIFTGWYITVGTGKEAYTISVDDYKTPVTKNLTFKANWVSGTEIPAGDIFAATDSGILVNRETGLVTVYVGAALEGLDRADTYDVTVEAPKRAASYYAGTDWDDVNGAKSTEADSCTAEEPVVIHTEDLFNDDGSVNSGETRIYVKWFTEKSGPLKTQAVTLRVRGVDEVISDYTGTEYKTRTFSVNPGFGRYKIYEDGKTASVTGWLTERRTNNSGTMGRFLDLSSYGEVFSDEGELKVVITPLEGQTFTIKNMPNIKVNGMIRGSDKQTNERTSMTPSVVCGKLILTFDLAKLDDVDVLDLVITGSTGVSKTQEITIGLNTASAIPGDDDNPDVETGITECETWEEAVAAIEKGDKAVWYVGEEDGTVTDNLTLKGNQTLLLMKAGLTVSEGATLTLKSGAALSANTLTVNGTIKAEGSSSLDCGEGTISGAVNITSGTLTLASYDGNIVLESGGKITVASGARLELYGTVLENSGEITGEGRYILTDGFMQQIYDNGIEDGAFVRDPATSGIEVLFASKIDTKDGGKLGITKG